MAAACAACGGAGSGEPASSPSTSSTSTAQPSAPRTFDDGAWGKFHSKRFGLTLPLPDGKAWKIDDHRAPDLVAVHPPTSSRVVVAATHEAELMNRQRCEERARARGWLADEARLSTVEDQVHVGPDAYDSRVWVAIDATPTAGGPTGHVFLFGAFVRRCLLVHFSTTVSDDEALASRLAIASARIVKGISMDPPRTTDDATVPRVRPSVRP